ncbi:hypothetical protein QJS04_geneDACA004785 [Acorus gramineus]|uniref:Omega-hydroxypalmitate O-feruloyl transferase n=1 Tax=Acorus gramineus TaxID=55184 RepID=A0AAV9BU14_ACOGR|nr:hypothetical protein QJS04_geneDACA004785 [Acorus gramineus]
MNHCTLDGRSAAEMFQCLASICRGEELKAEALFNDRTVLAARSPPRIEYAHTEYTKLPDTTTTTLPSSPTFTSPHQASLSPPPPIIIDTQSYKLFHFSSDTIGSLKSKAMTKCSSFEAIVAHIWRVRTRAVFEDPSEVSTVMFAVDITSKMNNPPLPIGFIGNAVITASASAQVVELVEQPLCFFVGKVRSAIERVTDDYVRSVIDWLEVHKGVPSTMNGNFFVSAWYKLPFHELDFGSGRPVFGGPVVSGLHEFVLLLSEGSNRKSCKNGEGDGLKKGGGINVWMVLEQHKMEKFMKYVFEM